VTATWRARSEFWDVSFGASLVADVLDVPVPAAVLASADGGDARGLTFAEPSVAAAASVAWFADVFPTRFVCGPIPIAPSASTPKAITRKMADTRNRDARDVMGGVRARSMCTTGRG
jgi:hypothetical protein